MVRTFDFVYRMYKNRKIQEDIIACMNSHKSEELDIEGWHLFFDQDRQWATITSNGNDDYLLHKFIPAEIEFESLLSLINPDENDAEGDLNIRYLD